MVDSGSLPLGVGRESIRIPFFFREVLMADFMANFLTIATAGTFLLVWIAICVAFTSTIEDSSR